MQALADLRKEMAYDVWLSHDDASIFCQDYNSAGFTYRLQRPFVGCGIHNSLPPDIKQP